ncbi:MAG: TfoX/Sxy family DNA transformation protein [Actinomycetales bacterium]
MTGPVELRLVGPLAGPAGSMDSGVAPPSLDEVRRLLGHDWSSPDRTLVVDHLRHGWPVPRPTAAAPQGQTPTRPGNGEPDPNRAGPVCPACGKDLPDALRSDGRYLWWMGLAHLVQEHAMHLPDEFIAHIRAQRSRLSAATLDTGWWTAWTSQATPLADLVNLDPDLVSTLNTIGVHTQDELRARGAVEVYRQLLDSGQRVGRVVLWRLAGAVEGRRWQELSAQFKAGVERELAQGRGPGTGDLVF